MLNAWFKTQIRAAGYELGTVMPDESAPWDRRMLPVANGEAVCPFVAEWTADAHGVVAVPFDPPLRFPTDLATSWPPTDAVDAFIDTACRVPVTGEGWLTERPGVVPSCPDRVGLREARPDGVGRSALADGAGEVADGIGVRRADHRDHAVHAQAGEAVVGRRARRRHEERVRVPPAAAWAPRAMSSRRGSDGPDGALMPSPRRPASSAILGPKPPTITGGGGEVAGTRRRRRPCPTTPGATWRSSTRPPPAGRRRRHRAPERQLLGGVRRPCAAAGTDAEQQPAAADLLQRRRHHGERAGVAVGDVEHERADRQLRHRRRQRAEDGPALEDVRSRCADPARWS